jgi:manganese transport protein
LASLRAATSLKRADHYSRHAAIFLWLVCEVAIAACDLAEVLGSAVALKLLFGVPSLLGVVIAYEIFVAWPLWLEAAAGFIPRIEILRNKEMLYIAIGILGATVMPHNLYLHSSIVQTRAFGEDEKGRREAIKYSVFDSTVALLFALFINAAILALGAAAFHGRELNEVADIAEAYKLLSPVLGVSLASTLFALALLASGQNSTDGYPRRADRHGGISADPTETVGSQADHARDRDIARDLRHRHR